MSEAQQIKAQAKRARCKIEDLLEYAKSQGAIIDVAVEAKKIRSHLNDSPKKARAAGPISRDVVLIASYMERLQRPQDLFRSA